MQKNGAELAIDEVNASGKLGDFKLVGIHQDDAGDRGQAVNIFQRLLNQDKVAVILGPTLRVRHSPPIRWRRRRAPR